MNRNVWIIKMWIVVFLIFKFVNRLPFPTNLSIYKYPGTIIFRMDLLLSRIYDVETSAPVEENQCSTTDRAVANSCSSGIHIFFLIRSMVDSRFGVEWEGRKRFIRTRCSREDREYSHYRIRSTAENEHRYSKKHLLYSYDERGDLWTIFFIFVKYWIDIWLLRITMISLDYTHNDFRITSMHSKSWCD